METRYGFGKSVGYSFEQAVERVTRELQKEGFGVLTEIDVAATLEKKLAKQMTPYRILGACNPALADRALAADPSIGLLLPCNVVVRQAGDASVHVEIMDPQAVMELVGRPEVTRLGQEVRERLERVMQAL